MRRIFKNLDNAPELNDFLLFDLDCEGSNVINAVTGTIITDGAKISPTGGPQGQRCMILASRYLIADPVLDEIGTGDMSVEAYIKINASGDGYRNLFTTAAANNSILRFDIRFGDSGFGDRFMVNNGFPGDFYDYYTTKFPGGSNIFVKSHVYNWVKIRVDRKDGIVRIFVNDVQVDIHFAWGLGLIGQQLNRSGNLAGLQPLYMGGNAGSNSNFRFNGFVYGAKIYNCSLIPD